MKRKNLQKLYAAATCIALLGVLGACGEEKKAEPQPTVTVTVTPAASAEATATEQKSEDSEKKITASAETAKAKPVANPYGATAPASIKPTARENKVCGEGNVGFFDEIPNIEHEVPSYTETQGQSPSADVSILKGPVVKPRQLDCVFEIRGIGPSERENAGVPYIRYRDVGKRAGVGTNPSNQHNMSQQAWAARGQYEINVNSEHPSGFLSCTVLTPGDAAEIKKRILLHGKDNTEFYVNNRYYGNLAALKGTASKFNLLNAEITHVHFTAGNYDEYIEHGIPKSIAEEKRYDDLDMVGNVLCFSSSKMEDGLLETLVNELWWASQLQLEPNPDF